MIKNVYISMNDVFTDFESYYATCAPYDPDQRPRWHEVITHVKIYSRLEILPGSWELAKYFMERPQYNTQILTSAETTVPRLYMETTLQRKNWLLRYGINFNPIITYNQYDKAQYANKESVLISANHKALTCFNMKGGHIINHTTFEEDIAHFEKIVQENALL